MRYKKFASSVTLPCVVLAFSLAACTSTSPGEGGSASVEANVTLAFPPQGPDQSVNQACGTIVCTGIDPILGVPRPSADNPEEFCIDLSTTEGPEPKNPVGLLAKRGLSAPGDCTISLKAQTTDGTTACEDEVTFPVKVNETSQVNMVLNCITDPQYGGVDVDGNFNQCPVYRQILVTPTLQSNGNDFTVRTEVYDADDDNANVIVESTCGGAITPAEQVRQSCEDVDGANCDAALTAVTCGTAGDCTITVTVAATLANEVDGCDGFLPNGMSNDAARQVIDVACQAQADCGNGVIDLGEECDPPSDPDDNANRDGVWCDSNCQLVDACDPTDRFCPTPAEGGFDAVCASTTCSVPATPVDGDTPTCGYDFVPEGTSCGAGEECDGAGICRVPPACTPGATECAVVACNTASCPAGVCVYTPDTTQDGDSCNSGTGSNAGACNNGNCDNTDECTATDTSGCPAAAVCTANSCNVAGAPWVCENNITEDALCNLDSDGNGCDTCDADGACQPAANPDPQESDALLDCVLQGIGVPLPFIYSVDPVAQCGGTGGTENVDVTGTIIILGALKPALSFLACGAVPPPGGCIIGLGPNGLDFTVTGGSAPAPTPPATTGLVSEIPNPIPINLSTAGDTLLAGAGSADITDDGVTATIGYVPSALSVALTDVGTFGDIVLSTNPVPGSLDLDCLGNNGNPCTFCDNTVDTCNGGANITGTCLEVSASIALCLRPNPEPSCANAGDPCDFDEILPADDGVCVDVGGGVLACFDAALCQIADAETLTFPAPAP